MPPSLPLASSSARPSALSALGYFTRTEVLKLLRVPAFTVPTLLFPIFFFALFGLPNVKDTVAGINAARFILVSFAAYSLMSISLFSFAVSIANERTLGWNRVLRVSPMPMWMYFVGKVLSALLLGLLGLGLLFGFAALAGNVVLPALTYGVLAGKLLAGMGVFVLLGLGLGYVAAPSAASALSNVLFLGLSFASGIFIPLENAPQFIRDVAPYLPTYHFAQIGWGTLGAQSSSSEAVHWLWLAGYAALFLAFAVWAYRRDEGRRFG